MIIQVGFHALYEQAHIPVRSTLGQPRARRLQQLRKRVESLPRTQFIVIYCGCCPWGHCPNIKPADDVLRAMGFTNVKVLDIPRILERTGRIKDIP